MSSSTAADYEIEAWEPPPPPTIVATSMTGARSSASISRIFNRNGCRMLEEILADVSVPQSPLLEQLTAGMDGVEARQLRSLLTWKRNSNDLGRWDLSLTPEHKMVRSLPIPTDLNLTAMTVHLRLQNDTIETSFGLRTTGRRALSEVEQMEVSRAAAPVSNWAVNHLLCAAIGRALAPELERLARKEELTARVQQRIELGQKSEATVQAPYVHRVSAFVSHSAF